MPGLHASCSRTMLKLMSSSLSLLKPHPFLKKNIQLFVSLMFLYGFVFLVQWSGGNAGLSSGQLFLNKPLATACGARYNGLVLAQFWAPSSHDGENPRMDPYGFWWLVSGSNWTHPRLCKFPLHLPGWWSRPGPDTSLSMSSWFVDGYNEIYWNSLV